MAPEHRERLDAVLREGRWSVPVEIVPGGATRQESVWNALESARGAELVAVHDAVRPLFGTELLGRVLAAARLEGAAVPGLPLTDTLHHVADGFVDESPGRDEWIAAQTPQCFALRILLEALERARAEGFAGTDEASVVGKYGWRVRVVPGEERNIKVTHPDDLARVAAILGES